MKKSRLTKKIVGQKDQDPKKNIKQIDILKGLAIISVIIIHTFSNEILMAIGAPFHIWQAVPVFILLAGFTSTYALLNYQKRSLAQSYDISIIIRRLKRLLGPYLIIWIFQFLIIFILTTYISLIVFDPNYFSYQGFDWLFNFFSGGQGPGNYFIPIILQQILIIPFFYYLALRSPNRMLAIAFILDLAFEYLAIISGIPPWAFSILYIRFIFAGALGVWLVFQKDTVPKWLLIGGLASIVYIFAVVYLNFQFWFLYPGQSFFNVFSFFWTIIIVILGMRLIPSGPSHRIFTILEQLGKASWHIFLIQMTFFSFLNGIFLKFVLGVPHVSLMTFNVIFCLMVNLMVNLMACLSLGYGFYQVQIWVSKKLNRKETISAS